MGKLFVIDGLDGSGKGTITKMLTEYLTKRGVRVRGISFPMYGTKGAALVEMYLGGELGERGEDTNCYTASSFFAMDRYISYKTDWGKFLAEDDTVIIADRYTTANAVHQLQKLPRESWDDFLHWLFDYEYGKLTLPTPDKTIYLKMPPEISMKLIAKRSLETGRVQDIHEKDPRHLQKAYSAAVYAADKLGWITVDSFEGDEPRNLELVFQDVLKALELEDSAKKEYSFPGVELLNVNNSPLDEDTIERECVEIGGKLIDVLERHRIEAEIVEISRGPSVTRFTVVPEDGVRARSIANLTDELALELAIPNNIRALATTIGMGKVIIEIPNPTREAVFLGDLIDNGQFEDESSPVTAAIGVDIDGSPVYANIEKMPHLLLAGATGMGKSVALNCIIASILYKAKPDEVGLVLIDTKKVELELFSSLPHLMMPVVTDFKKSVSALEWAAGVMERRYTLLQNEGVRDISGYNKLMRSRNDQRKMERIVVVIDELADLMAFDADSVETSICRIAQKGRAAGVHLVVATQRPRSNVITGLIKANIPSRILFKVASKVDSRTVIDMAGGEVLLGKGDMLYCPVGVTAPKRVQGAYVSDYEIKEIVEYIKKNNPDREFDSGIMAEVELAEKKYLEKAMEKSCRSKDGRDDENFFGAVELAISLGKISTALLQREFKIGYMRAARIIEAMENEGYISEQNGCKPREVLISSEEWQNIQDSEQ